MRFNQEQNKINRYLNDTMMEQRRDLVRLHNRMFSLIVYCVFLTSMLLAMMVYSVR